MFQLQRAITRPITERSSFCCWPKDGSLALAKTCYQVFNFAVLIYVVSLTVIKIATLLQHTMRWLLLKFYTITPGIRHWKFISIPP